MTFMREEYFPAVHKGLTRVGQVTDLRLLERENEFEGDNLEHDFFWHVGWSGQPTGEVAIDDEAVVRKLVHSKPRLSASASIGKLLPGGKVKQISLACPPVIDAMSLG